jgi:hypothetical protein
MNRIVIIVCGLVALVALSTAFLVVQPEMPIIHFPGLVPLTMLACLGAIFWAASKR